MNQLIIINATELFNRPSYLYALGDLKLSRPISLKFAGYLLVFFMAWSLPLYLVLGLALNPFSLAFMFGPPFLLAQLSTKPLFGGKALLEFAGTLADFFSEPKGWLDGNSSNMKEESFQIVNEIWIGRRRELQILADLVEGRAFIQDEEAEINDENLVRVPSYV